MVLKAVSFLLKAKLSREKATTVQLVEAIDIQQRK
jgi:hypothetical protein